MADIETVTQFELIGRKAGLTTVWEKGVHKPSGLELEAHPNETRESLLMRLRRLVEARSASVTPIR